MINNAIMLYVCLQVYNTMINTYTTDYNLYIIAYNVHVPYQFSDILKPKYTQILLLEVLLSFRILLSPVDELVAILFSELSMYI